MRHISPYLGLFQDTAFYFKANKEIVILEIGVREGFSTRAFLNGLAPRKKEPGWKVGKLYSIDMVDCSRCVKHMNPEDSKDWTFILGDSKKIDWDREIDILFIDGDHTYEGAKADFEKYLPFMSKGGLIFMHDVGHPKLEVKKLWAEITLPKAVINSTPSCLGIINI